MENEDIKKLRLISADTALDSVKSGFMEYTSAFYPRAFQGEWFDRIIPELLKKKGGEFPALDRAAFLSCATPEARRKAAAEAYRDRRDLRAALNSVSSNDLKRLMEDPQFTLAAGNAKLNGRHLQRSLSRIDDETFSEIAKDETPKMGKNERDRVCRSLDMSASFSLNRKRDTGREAAGYYEDLKAAYQLAGVDVSSMYSREWNRVFEQAVSARNTYYGHDSTAGRERMAENPEELRKALESIKKAAETLKSGQLEKKYNACIEKISQGLAALDNVIFSWRETDLHGLAPAQALKILSSRRDIECSGEWICCRSREYAGDILKDAASGGTLPLKEIAESAGISEAEAASMLGRYGAASGEHVLHGRAAEALIAAALKEKKEEERKKKQKDKQQASAGNPGYDEMEECLSRLESARSMEHFEGGKMTNEQIAELAGCSRIVLDSAVFLSPAGRSLIRNVIAPLAEKGAASVSVLSSCRAKLLHGAMQYKKMKEQWIASIAEARSGVPQPPEMKQAKEYDTAYHVMKDALLDRGAASIIGVYSPLESEDEAMADALSFLSAERTAVFVCGKAGWLKLTDTEKLPLLTACRLTGTAEAPEARIGRGFYPLLSKNDPSLRQRLAWKFGIDNKTAGYADDIGGMDSELPENTEIPENAAEDLEQAETPAVRNEPETAQIAHDTQKIQVQDAGPDARLPMSRQAGTGDTLYDGDGRSVILTGPLIENGSEARGGEGAIFNTSIPGKVAKIYYADENVWMLTEGRKEKILAMTASNPGIKELCWPEQPLYNSENQFAGYLMSQVPQGWMNLRQSVLKISNEDVREGLLPGWDRQSLAYCASAVAGAFEKMHKHGILMGDVNPSNIMICPEDSKKVMLVDCDSYQAGGFPCPVYTPDYSHPLLRDRAEAGTENPLMRTEAEEDYSMAVILFMIMMQIGPFEQAGITGDEDFRQAMRDRKFVYADYDRDSMPGGYYMIAWSNLPKKASECFTRTFKNWEDVKPDEFRKAMSNYAFAMDYYGRSKDIMPRKFDEHDKDNPRYVSITCPGCGQEFNVTKRLAESQAGKNGRLFCLECRNVIKVLEEMPAVIECRICGKKFQGNQRMNETGPLGTKKECPECRKFEKAVCPRCGKTFTDRLYYINKYKNSGGRQCQECRNSYRKGGSHARK